MNSWCMKWTVSPVTQASSVMKLGSPPCPGPAVRASSVWATPHQPPPMTEPTDRVLLGITVRLVSSWIRMSIIVLVTLINDKLEKKWLIFVAEIFLRLRLIFEKTFFLISSPLTLLVFVKQIKTFKKLF